MIIKNKKAFTLVELIIVITILAILATIWFMSYQSYIADSRDWKRKADLSELRNWVETYLTKNAILPDPSNKVSLLNSWSTNYVSQWYMASNALWKIRASWDFKDNLDSNLYHYTIDSAKKKYQITALLEWANSSTWWLSMSWIYRYPYAVWNNMWFFLAANNTPLQEYLSWNVDLAWTNSWLVLNTYFANTSVTATGLTTLTYVSRNSTNSRYPGCNKDDIVVWTYIIAACNPWVTTAGTWASSYGNYYQWGRNKWFYYTDSSSCSSQIATGSYNPSTDILWFVYFAGVYWLDWNWLNWHLNDLWWWITKTNIAMKGPCADGYHVPTKDEWNWIYNAWAWWTNWNKLSNDLLLPKVWCRYPDDWSYHSQWWAWYYWASTPTSCLCQWELFSFTWSTINPNDSDVKWFWFSVRCIKN